MRIALLIPIALLASGSAPAPEERRVLLTGFDRIRIDGPFEVRVVAGPPSAVVTGDRRAVEALHDAARAGSEVLVVTSGITIMSLLQTLGADLAHLRTGPANLSVSTLRRDGDAWVIDRIASPDPVAN